LNTLNTVKKQGLLTFLSSLSTLYISFSRHSILSPIRFSERVTLFILKTQLLFLKLQGFKTEKLVGIFWNLIG